MESFKQNMREIFSGTNGKLSSKRVIGGIAMAIVLICTSYLVIRDGSTGVVENLLMTIFITSASLLGLPAVTGIWNNSKISVGKTLNETTINTEQDTQPETQEEIIQETTVDCDNCYYKLKANKKAGK